MSNSFVRPPGFQSCSASTTLRTIRCLALAIVSMAVLVVPVLAQHRSAAKSHHSKNRAKPKSVSQTVPHSLPSSAVPQAGGAKPSSSRQELDRIERSSQVKPATQKSHAAPVYASHLSNTHERSAPMSFSYQAPRAVTKGNRPPNATRTR
jgi:hypothetical protein